MEEEIFSSDSSDEDYVPDAGEQVSEEEESGVDEDCDIPDDTRKTGTKKKSRKRMRKLISRKCRAGAEVAAVQEELNFLTASDDLPTESCKESETDRKQKEKADTLWADFLKDVGSVPKKSHSDNASVCSSLAANCSEAGLQSAARSVSVTKQYEFAGETVTVVKLVPSNSTEGKQAVQSDSASSVLKRPATSAAAVGLSSVLGKIGKKPKISVLEKSKLDWDGFKQDEGISEELTTHNRGKDGYLERQAFLQRTDLRQFEIERNLRLASSSTLPPMSKR